MPKVNETWALAKSTVNYFCRLMNGAHICPASTHPRKLLYLEFGLSQLSRLHARRAKPRTTEVSSPPLRRRAASNFCAKTCLMAGTKDEPPVRKMQSTAVEAT